MGADDADPDAESTVSGNQANIPAHIRHDLEVDDGSFPEAVVLRFVLAETPSGLTAHAGHEAAVDVLDRLERTERVHVEALSASTFTTATARFRTFPALSLVDACLVAHAERADHESLYAFDDDFDGVDEVVRLGTATNPYDPEP